MSKISNNTNSGLSTFNIIETGELFIKGKRFKDYISELAVEDRLEQAEIDEIKLVLQYLNTSGLSSEWIVDNNNKNQDLKTLITTLQTKLANIDTTALTETSVLNNDNRNSVLKTRIDTASTDITSLTTRVTTAETDINAIEVKTKYIEVNDGDYNDPNTINSFSIGYVPNSGTTLAKHKKSYFGLGGLSQGILFEHIDQELDDLKIYNVYGPMTLWSQHNTLRAANTDIGFVNQNVGAYGETINIGSSMSRINIGSVEDPKIGVGTPIPDSDFNNSTKITIGKRTTLKNTWTYLQGNFYTNEARWEDLPRTDKFTWTQLASLIPTTGVPLWVVSFALTSSIPNFELSDTVVLKDGGTGQNKSGEMTTSNNLKMEGLVIFNKSLNIGQLTPIEGTFVARGTISKTTLDGSVRNSVFLDGGGNNKISLKHHNIAVSDIGDWATTEANSKVNVVEIGGNSGILIHQGAANAETDLKLVNTKGGNIVLKCGATNGILADAKESFTVLHDANYPGAAVGRLSPQAFDTNVTNRTNNPIARLEIDCVANRKGIRLFGYLPDQPFTLSPDETTLTNQLINTPAITATTTTATSLVINGNYTGDTTNRLYKDADNKLYWNGAEVGSGGSSSGGGIDYYIPLANNIVNPAPNPTIQTMDEVYVSSVTKTIKQSTTAVATGLFMASYRTPVFNKTSNPTISGVQTVQQWLDWSENNTVGQIYGRLYYEAAVSNNSLLYDKKYIDVVSTSYATVINGTPIDAPASLFLISFQRVIFEFVDIDVTGTSCQIKCRLEGQDLITENWNILQTSAGTKTYTSDSINQIIDFTGENFFYQQTSTTNASIKYRVSLYVSNSGGSIRQTVAGGTDLGAYQLGSNTNDFARIRVLLYDGINQKKTIQHSITPTLFSLDLPVSVPYNISAFNFSRLGIELYMYQPTGAVNSNHIMTLYFNDGYISHFETSLNIPPPTTPTLAQVMTSGATASSDLSMGNFGITNVSSIQNWNVKEITAGTNITRGISNGNYTITNSAPVQDINNNGTNITVSKTSNVATITNSAPVQDINNNGTNILVSIDATTKTATINNSAPVQNVIAGPGIEVQINATTKTATINNLGVSGQATRDEDNVIVDVGAEWRKPDYWLNNWADAESSSREHQDIYVSVDGSIVVSAAGTGALMSSRDYGVNWSTTNVINVSWTAVSGTSQGSKLYAFGSETTVPTQQIVLYTSLDYGLTWTRFTSPAFFAEISRINKVRTSGDGRYVIATDNSQPGTAAKFLYSSDFGATFTRRSLTEPTGPNGHTYGVCISRSGATQFITLKNIRGDVQANSAVYRSFDYGATFVAVQNYITDSNSIKAYWHNIDCDATGRFVWASRYNDTSSNPWAFYSADYGATWKEAPISGIIDIVVSGSGQHIAAIRNQTNIGGGIMSSFTVFSSNYGQQFNSAQVANTLFTSIGANSDLTNVFIGSGLPSSGDGKLRVSRQGRQNIQDLSVVGGTIAKSGGVYTLTNDVVLWVSSVLTRTNSSVIPLTFQAIDLTQFNIQYEFDINWNHAPSGTIIPDCFIEMNVNGISTAAIFLPQNQTGAFPAQTNWTNAITEGNTQTVSDINQSYRQRFFTGFAPLQVQTTTFRNRTRISGELSLSRRITEESGITDNSINSRQLLNKFNCDNSLIQNISTTQWYSYAPANSGSNEWAFSHQRIHGTAIWELSAGDYWSAGPSPINAGISNLTLFLTTINYGVVNRGSETSCRIYRVRK